MPRGKRAGGRRGRPTMLASTSTADLKRELERRQGMIADLIRQRDELNAEIDALQGGAGAMSSNGASAGQRRGPGRPPGKRGRPAGSGGSGRGANKNSLVESLQQVLSGKTMSVAEVSDAVQKAGYKTKSPNFRTIVNQALLANPSKFKKVARGEYTAR